LRLATAGLSWRAERDTDGRRAYLLELDPLYRDLIVRRWEEFAGKKPEREAAVSGTAVRQA